MAELTDLATYKPKYTGAYHPKVNPMPKDVATAILAGASHQAWVWCIKNGETKPGSARKAKFSVHKAKTREFAQAAFKTWTLAHLS